LDWSEKRRGRFGQKGLLKKEGNYANRSKKKQSEKKGKKVTKVDFEDGATNVSRGEEGAKASGAAESSPQITTR